MASVVSRWKNPSKTQNTTPAIIVNVTFKPLKACQILVIEFEAFIGAVILFGAITYLSY